MNQTINRKAIKLLTNFAKKFQLSNKASVPFVTHMIDVMIEEIEEGINPQDDYAKINKPKSEEIQYWKEVKFHINRMIL